MYRLIDIYFQKIIFLGEASALRSFHVVQALSLFDENPIGMKLLAFLAW